MTAGPSRFRSFAISGLAVMRALLGPVDLDAHCENLQDRCARFNEDRPDLVDGKQDQAETGECEMILPSHSGGCGPDIGPHYCCHDLLVRDPCVGYQYLIANFFPAGTPGAWKWGIIERA